MYNYNLPVVNNYGHGCWFYRLSLYMGWLISVYNYNLPVVNNYGHGCWFYHLSLYMGLLVILERMQLEKINKKYIVSGLQRRLCN